MAEYGEAAGGGIRGGKQGPLFEEGNVYLNREFPKLDYIIRATVLTSPNPKSGGSAALDPSHPKAGSRSK